MGLVITAAALLVAAPIFPDQPWWSAVVAAGFVLTLGAALWLRAPGAIRATLVAMVIAALVHTTLLTDGPRAIVTVVEGVVLLAAWPLFARWPALRPTGAWLTVGRFSAPVVWLTVGLIAVSAVALTVWTTVVQPKPPPFLADLAGTPPVLIVAGMIGFSLVNGVWEEALYRGILQTELTAAWGATPAVVVQAVAFGIAHLHGFPSGWVGALLAGTWGLVLGVLRTLSGGMAAPYVAHICADATIAVLVVTLLM